MNWREGWKENGISRSEAFVGEHAQELRQARLRLEPIPKTDSIRLQKLTCVLRNERKPDYWNKNFTPLRIKEAIASTCRRIEEEESRLRESAN